ncbi:MAG TPA: hypothetical protein VKX25_19590 [Bryobacteraceae bacterium]|jgi:hypothetical protein|nr:hypothetical protein [Bryobacteraceae bacterium]
MNQCRFCGCTDNNACVDMETGMTCGWATADVCTFCSEHDPVADFVLQARFAHLLAERTIPEFTAEEHARAARLYQDLTLETTSLGVVQ